MLHSWHMHKYMNRHLYYCWIVVISSWISTSINYTNCRSTNSNLILSSRTTCDKKVPTLLPLASVIVKSFPHPSPKLSAISIVAQSSASKPPHCGAQLLVQIRLMQMFQETSVCQAPPSQTTYVIITVSTRPISCKGS